MQEGITRTLGLRERERRCLERERERERKRERGRERESERVRDRSRWRYFGRDRDGDRGRDRDRDRVREREREREREPDLDRELERAFDGDLDREALRRGVRFGEAAAVAEPERLRRGGGDRDPDWDLERDPDRDRDRLCETTGEAWLTPTSAPAAAAAEAAATEDESPSWTCAQPSPVPRDDTFSAAMSSAAATEAAAAALLVVVVMWSVLVMAVSVLVAAAEGDSVQSATAGRCARDVVVDACTCAIVVAGVVECAVSTAKDRLGVDANPDEAIAACPAGTGSAIVPHARPPGSGTAHQASCTADGARACRGSEAGPGVTPASLILPGSMAPYAPGAESPGARSSAVDGRSAAADTTGATGWVAGGSLPTAAAAAQVPDRSSMTAAEAAAASRCMRTARGACA